jgi:hypothetical protein
MSKFTPPPNSLLAALGEILDLAEVSGEDTTEALTQWLENPPDDDYENLLSAKLANADANESSEFEPKIPAS